MPRRTKAQKLSPVQEETTFTELDAAIDSVSGRKVTVRRDRATKEITVLEAVLENLAQLALKGGSHATKQMIDLFMQVEEKKYSLREEEIRVWTSYKKHTEC
ncbi:DUF5681 domain-containing protein [uncultured Roseobacter sp.]|uniref:DUF5681 domain-containing protein n=1 Tax=uncultured Roseobacter sp. TaxID=114847 RepID=UPI002605F275|nr:DUF5681 domain-containing protein [uncultured Roseobacter sp.]